MFARFPISLYTVTEGSSFMTSSPFTLRSDADLLATFRSNEQKNVVLPRYSPYPFLVERYHAWTDPSGVYTYLVFKRADWETPLGLVFQKNKSGSHNTPAGMCEWCHTPGAADEIGLMTTSINAHSTGGTWLCLDLTCMQKIEEQTGEFGKNGEKRIQNLLKRMGEFYQRVRIDPK